MNKQLGTKDSGQLAKTVKCPTLGSKSDSSKKNTSVGSTSSGKKNRSGKKKALKAPFIHEWPAVSDSTCEEVVGLLKETFESEGLRRDLCKRAGSKVKHKSQSESSGVNVDKSSNWNSLIFGINAVTRSLERVTTSLVLCDRNTYPSRLTSHLVELCAHNRVPAASVTGLSTLAETVGLRSLTTFAFKPLSEIDNEPLKSAISSIIKKLPIIKSPIQSQDIPKFDLKTDIEAQIITELPGMNTSNPVPTLPPDDVDFSSLYVFKESLNFTKQEDFISLGAVLKRESDTPSQVPANKLRYMSTQVGLVKYNPNRPKINRTKMSS